MPEILFLCTGNYYRSRFAEALFNQEAAARGLPWTARSRGLAIHLAPPDDLSPVTRAELQRRGIPLTRTGARPVQVTEADFPRAARVVALQRTEHRPFMLRLHPTWARRIVYWQVGDLDTVAAEEGLAEIARQVLALLDELAGSGAADRIT